MFSFPYFSVLVPEPPSKVTKIAKRDDARLPDKPVKPVWASSREQNHHSKKTAVCTCATWFRPLETRHLRLVPVSANDRQQTYHVSEQSPVNPVKPVQTRNASPVSHAELEPVHHQTGWARKSCTKEQPYPAKLPSLLDALLNREPASP